jgi:CheY-like chemotaxis protein
MNPDAEKGAEAANRGIEWLSRQLYSLHRAKRQFVHVLIIEDEPLIAMSIQFALEEAGVTSFDIAESESQAVHCARANRPCFITSDVHLKVGTGPAAVRAILGELGEIPVIFVTANPESLMLENCTQTVMSKPFAAAEVGRAFQRATMN